ncbi:MAG: HAD-IC family P-type ATPase [Planctomycetales bacterium]|nr:HAD-IC family P-type ATPase [Planctomycetales bacterium]
MNQFKQPEGNWHSLPLREVTDRLRTCEQGLSEEESARRLNAVGANRLPQGHSVKLWVVILRQFQSPLIYILGLAAVVSVSLGDWEDAGFIAGVLVLNAMIGAYQEWKAEQSSEALKKLLQIRASVQRDGEVQEINAEAIVPGDVVWLESGNRVPADVRLVRALGLELDESLLTGESLPVIKDPSWRGDESTPVADRINMAHAGSIVTRGRAKGIVVATGVGTSVGQLAQDVLGEVGGKPPLLLRMERFTRLIAVVVLSASVLIGILGVAIGGYSIAEMFMFTVALAVAAIPEGLPVAMTIALAIATTRMARRGLIVRRLTAVEGLGSCTLIATDKTGTLTCNELTVREVRLPNGDVYHVSGEGFVPIGEVLRDETAIDVRENRPLEWLVQAGLLCNEADLHPRHGEWVWRGDAVDIALLTFGQKLGRNCESASDRYPQVNRIPFEPEYQFAASFNQVDSEVAVFVKGAAERVLAMCTQSSYGAFDQAKLETVAIRMAERGFRVLALADGRLESSLTSADVPPAPEQLRFLGFVGMIDPLRAGAAEAVRSCHEAGVLVSMITGDHRVTAMAIARDLGLAEREDQVITGPELLQRTPEELQDIVRRIRVFARVAPRQKLLIVEAAQRAGNFVAVTGDGVNDAPALQAANIGVAMGKSGTDVAREAAALVISDDNFATIVGGIEEGRVAYDNIRKVIYFLLSTGAAELVLMALALSTGTPYLPLLPVQLLWLNLVTSGIQDVALAFEPNEGGVLERPPRSPNEPIFNQLMIERTVIAAIVMGGFGFAAFWWLLSDDPSEAGVSAARNALLLLMVLFENIHIGNCRSETKPALVMSPFRSPILLAGAVAAFLVHLAAMHLPMTQSLLGTAPIGWKSWGALFLLALTVFPAMELHKWSWSWRERLRS